MDNHNNKIGAIRLSGLMVGPILGSGIILLPPLAYSKLGLSSIWAWLIIMGLGGIFALIFAKLTIEYPGDGGMTIAIEKKLGKSYRVYASFLMMTAVTFGPTAVMLTAADYLVKLPFLSDISPVIVAMTLIFICHMLLSREIKFISTLSLITSMLIGGVLVVSAATTLLHNGIHLEPLSLGQVKPLGNTLMLLFWAIIGWEIVGNYALQVKNLKKTIPVATGMSLVVVTLIYLIVALAIQSFGYSKHLSLVDLLLPLFGGLSEWILALLIAGLCLSTYLLIVGALARLVYDLSVDRILPKVFNVKNKNDIPMRAVLYFSAAHLLVLALVGSGILNLEIIVSIANGFFLANALIGLTVSFSIVKGWFFKSGAVILSICLLILLMFSSPLLWVVFGIEGVAVFMIMRRSIDRQSMQVEGQQTK